MDEWHLLFDLIKFLQHIKMYLNWVDGARSLVALSPVKDFYRRYKKNCVVPFRFI